MKKRKLLTLLAAVTSATSGVDIAVETAPQSVQAQTIEYYLLDHNTNAYDGNGKKLKVLFEINNANSKPRVLGQMFKAL